MTQRRGVVLVLLVLVVAGFVVQAARGPATTTTNEQPAAVATPTPVKATGTTRAVLRALADVERAYDAGNVRRLCRPGELVDPAVVRAENAQGDGCESALESLIANVPRLRVSVRGVGVRADLATVSVVASDGTAGTVDFVRSGQRWLLSFSDGADPLPALAGAT